MWVVFNGEIYNFRCPAASSGGCRTCVSHARRWRDDRPPVRGPGRRVFFAFQRDVRHRHLGCAAWASGAGSRSSGKEAAGVSLRAASAAVCQRIEEPAAGAGGASRDRSDGARSLPDLPVHSASVDDLSRDSQAAAGPLCRVRRRAAHGRKVLESGLQCHLAGERAGRDRGAANDAGIVRAVADAERRAAGCFPVGRCRFVADRGHHAAIGIPAGQDVFHRVSGARVRRNRLCPAGGRASADGPSRIPGHAGRPGHSAQAGVALRRAVCRQFGDSDVVCVAADTAARDGGVVGRRRGRVVCRVSAVSGGPLGNAARSHDMVEAVAGRPVSGSGCPPRPARNRSCGSSGDSVRRWGCHPPAATWTGSRPSGSRAAPRCTRSPSWTSCPRRIPFDFWRRL